MSDANLVACEEDHEMKYILKINEKRETNQNVEKLREACRNFKKDPDYKPHNRDSFYKYMKDKNILSSLE